MNLDLGYDYIISRLLCKKWKFLREDLTGAQMCKDTIQECGTSSRKGQGTWVSWVPFCLPLHHFQGYNDGPVFWGTEQHHSERLSWVPKAHLPAGTAPVASEQHICSGSAFLEKDRKTDPPCPSTGHSVRKWNKSENIHYRIWIPAVCSQLCLLLASHSVPLHLYFLVCSDMTWS